MNFTQYFFIVEFSLDEQGDYDGGNFFKLRLIEQALSCRLTIKSELSIILPTKQSAT